MPRQPSQQNSNAFQRYLNNIREYIGRCFGIDDPEACYARQITECEKEKNAAQKSDKRFSKNSR